MRSRPDRSDVGVAVVVWMVVVVHCWEVCVCLQVIRRMLRSRESFDIDNANLRAREAAIQSRFEEHVTATDARFHAEAEDRYNTSNALRESLGTWTSVTDRDEAVSFTATLLTLAEGKRVLSGESRKREAGDAVVMDSLQKSMTQLQAMILENFGSA
jgi:hypothetical protein